jgi:hypothetical protein
MTGYTKLFSSIVTSTVWQEDLETKVVWITMLAMSDAHGFVNATVPGLSHIAGVSVEKTREAVAKFLSPDPDSRTKHDEGRRIREVPGGWRLLNYQRYRQQRDPERRKAQNREAKRRQRQREQEQQKCQQHVSQSQPKSAQAEAEADTIDKASALSCRNSDGFRLSDLLLNLIFNNFFFFSDLFKFLVSCSLPLHRMIRHQNHSLLTGTRKRISDQLINDDF